VLRIHGYVEVAVHTTPGTESEERAGRSFDDDSEGFRFHQAYLAAEKPVTEASRFDVGGKLAGLWGADARLLHSTGLLDDQDSEEQFDLLEAHLLVRLPLLRGTTLTAGKFVSPLGYEAIESTEAPLPSRSFLFGYAVPSTHTGAMATFDIGSGISLGYGLVLGWDAWEDSNDSLSHLGTFQWTGPGERDVVAVSGIFGPELEGNDEDGRLLIDAWWQHDWSERTYTTLNADFAVEQAGTECDCDDPHWWGFAGYLAHELTPCLTGTVRAEWFVDEDGTRLGEEARLGEVTLGLDWRPVRRWSWFHVRPEVRWDHSFGSRFFDDGEDSNQLSFILDVLLGS
jgi:hypothetical protein